MRIVVGLLVSIAYLICLLATKPYVSLVDDHLATGLNAILVFVFLGAMLIRIHTQISERYGPSAAAKILAFENTETLTIVLAGLCLLSVVMLLLLTFDIARRERKERRAAEKWAAQTLDPPCFDWRPTRQYAAFLSVRVID